VHFDWWDILDFCCRSSPYNVRKNALCGAHALCPLFRLKSGPKIVGHFLLTIRLPPERSSNSHSQPHSRTKISSLREATLVPPKCPEVASTDFVEVRNDRLSLILI
jgi:hypothetical protein